MTHLSRLETLRAAKSLHDVATLLGFTPSSLAYILYAMPRVGRYTSFSIPKRDGGVRVIDAPAPKLKLLQRRLADLLYECSSEIEATAKPNNLSHAFRKNFSVLTNAEAHKNHRYVLNVDFADFFPSLNFGRIRGFFIKHRSFGLNAAVGTIIAQIAVNENGALAQGSPCSPIISELLTHFFDIRMMQFSRKHRCTYTRYADDLTFSTNVSQFPKELAILDGAEWVLSNEFILRVERSGFRINGRKTRMQLRAKRQTVTGLVVNRKVNVQANYYRSLRAMTRSLLHTGAYKSKSSSVTSIRSLEGMLNHVFYIREKRLDEKLRAEQNEHARKQLLKDRAHDKRNRPSAIRRMFHRVLFYRHFVVLDHPVLLCEGPTDSIYLKEAIRALSLFHPSLGAAMPGGAFKYAVRFFQYTRQTEDILQLGGGSGDIVFMLSAYRRIMHDIKHQPLLHPVVILVDNDAGGKSVFDVVKKVFGVSVSHSDGIAFYPLMANLYLVKTPSVHANGTSMIEDFFDPALLTTIVEGKKFNPYKPHEAPGEYGKTVFANRVVRTQSATIDFSGFAPLLANILSCINAHALTRTSLATTSAAE